MKNESERYLKNLEIVLLEAARCAAELSAVLQEYLPVAEAAGLTLSIKRLEDNLRRSADMAQRIINNERSP